MPRYRTYGALDDRVVRDGDIGFIGFNNRIRPDQLGQGVLSDSQNLRLDLNGEAQVRKGIELIEAPFAIGDAVLRLPSADEIISDDTGNPTQTILPSTIKSASLNAGTNVVTLVVESLDAGRDGHDWAVSDVVVVNGVVSTATDVNGTHTIASVTDGTDVVTITYTLSSSVASTLTVPFTLQFILDDGGTEPTLSDGFSQQATIGYEMAIDESQVTQVYASTSYSDPNSQDSQYIILAANNSAVAKNLETGVTHTINYTGTESVGNGATMLHAFNKVFIFREGSTALFWDGDFNNDFELVASGEYEQPVQIVCESGDFAITENRGVVHQPDGVSVGSVIELLSAKTDPSDQTSGLKAGAKFDVAKIFTPGSSFSITAASVGAQISGGEYDSLYKATLTIASHTFSVGDPVDIAGFSDSKLDGARFVAEKTASSISVYIPQSLAPSISGDETATLANGFEFYINSDGYDGRVTDGLTLLSTPIFTREVSVGLGFTHMPAPPYAAYHQRRLVMPFKYTVNNASNSYTLRASSDEIIASDILDSDTYDQIYAQYRFNAGTSDFNVGLHSFSNDTLIVFNRNSIHEVRGMTDIKNSTSRLITDEVGLVARRSVVQVGSSVIFLSDNGVYNLQFLDEYNLRGGEVPMSEPISATIQRINQNHWDKSVAVYFDNRYYLSVPLDGANKNNAILIYSFLNNQWESIDTVNNTDWDVSNLLIAGSGDARGVYAINELGGIHRLDYRSDGQDRVITSVGGGDLTYNVRASMTTRQYTMGTMGRKKWQEFDIHIQSDTYYRSDLTIGCETENPDAVFTLGTLSSYNNEETLAENEDISIRGRIGNQRGYGLQFTINNTSGRPRIRNIETYGSAAFRSTLTAD